jgi:hypothetical protein
MYKMSEQETKLRAFEKEFHELGKTEPGETCGLKEKFLVHAFMRWPWVAKEPFAPKINALLEKLPTLSESTQLHFLEKAVSETRPDLRNYILNTTQYEIVKAENELASTSDILVELAEQGNISPVVVVRPNQGEGVSKKKRKKKKKTRRKKKLR